MPAPKGNKNAVGHGCGRPRTVCPDDDELVVLGEELIKWCFEEPVAKKMHITQWWSGEKFIVSNVWDQMRKQVIFRHYYEFALRVLAIKYIDGTINPAIAQRFLRLYFGDLRANDDELLKLKASLAKKQEQDEDDNDVRKIAQAIKAAEGLS